MKNSCSILRLIVLSFLFTLGCSKDDEKEVASSYTPPPPPPPPPINIRPIANSGTDHLLYVPRDSITIDAGLSKDIDGTIVSYSITQLSGPAPSVIEKHLSMPHVHRIKKLILGSYIFELKVTDNN